MSKNTRTAPALATVAEATVAEATVAPEQATADDATASDYTFDIATVVSDYLAGRVTKRDATALVAKVRDDALDEDDFAAAKAAGKVAKELAAAQRSAAPKAKAETTPAEWAALMVARAVALKVASDGILFSGLVASDVPETLRSEVAACVAAIASDAGQASRVNGDLLTEEEVREVVAEYVSPRVMAKGDIKAHFQAILDGTAKVSKDDGTPLVIEVGSVHPVSTFAKASTEAYPLGVSNGHVASRFTHKGADGKRYPHPAFKYAPLADGRHGVQRIA